MVPLFVVVDVMASSFSTRRLTYLAATLVALFEGAVLAATAMPDVTDDYRRYFIERSTNCWTRDVPGEGRFSQNIALVVEAATDPHRIVGSHMLVCGWSLPGESGTWAIGPEAALRFNVSSLTGRELNLHLNISPYVFANHPRQSVQVAIGETQVASLLLDSDSDAEQSIRIPADLATSAVDGTLDVWFQFPDAVSPQELGIGDDARRFSVRLISLRLEPVPEQ